jgi:hypothetical protein
LRRPQTRAATRRVRGFLSCRRGPDPCVFPPVPGA